MNLKELGSFKLSDAVKFHDALNPRLWENDTLRPEVKDQLLLIAEDFLTELGVSDLDVVDITISGSNAAYSWTPHSDLDLHILVDIELLNNDELYRELFTSKKNIYNDTHDITVHGVPVELYVQDVNEPVISLGEYSILNDEWLKMPIKRRANLDHTATKEKLKKLLSVVKDALRLKDAEKLTRVLEKIKQYRKAGLARGGEFSPENLAYKILRTHGYIDRLYQLKNRLHSQELSIESVTDEDYDPNGPPPGPEFKPTMPPGTVRVDVSDVYDWYKLGQHISNMKGLGKHDFGKGPPSTIMSFGSEPEEHKYINYLEKTGLTTTDIDPIDKNQPKGMKRQKVDPTFNVGESALGNIPEFVYHVTPARNLKHIMKQGLKPMIGSRSEKIAGERSGIYVFPDQETAEDAVMTWLGDEFDEDEPLTMLKINVSGLEGNITRGADYELIVDANIEPSRIKKLNVELEEASGYIPSEKEKNDWRFKTALTVDVHPDTMKKNAKKFGNKISRAGIPPTLRADGKY